MKHKKTFKLLLFVCLIISVFFLTNCESEDDDNVVTQTPAPTTTPTPTPVVTKTITGTVAAGAPIVGMVNVKGADGNTASADIDSDGLFNLDVTSLTAPYILMAEGTVNGKSVKLYSTGVEEGNINITPITNLITSQVLEGLDEVFDNWATESTTVNTAAIEAAETTVQEQLAPILDSYGITDEIDLMSVDFDTDHSGLDAVLDIVKIEIDDSNTATITNVATGTTVTGDEEFSESEGTAMVQVISETAAMNIVWTMMNEAAGEDGVITTSEANAFVPYIADDMMSIGRTKAETLDNMTAEPYPANVTFSGSIKALMDSSEYDAAYSKGYWINVYITFGTRKITETNSMVFNGTNWLIYGNRHWIDTWFNVGAYQSYMYNPTSDDYDISYTSELRLKLEENTNYAYDRGIRYGLVCGPGMPGTGPDGKKCLIQQHGYPDDDAFYDYGLTLSTDAIAAAIPENYEFEILLFETDDFTGTTPLHTFNRTLTGKPFLPSEITASMFPTLSEPSTHDLDSLNIGGDITISWRNLTDCKVFDVGVRWGDELTYLNQSEEITIGDETVTIDTSTNNISSPNWAEISLECYDLSNRRRNVSWTMH